MTLHGTPPSGKGRRDIDIEISKDGSAVILTIRPPRSKKTGGWRIQLPVSELTRLLNSRVLVQD